MVFISQADALPPEPRGFSWLPSAFVLGRRKMVSRRIPLTERSPQALRAQAAEYRQMAATARTAVVVGGLMRLADRVEALADQRERDAKAGGNHDERRRNTSPGHH